MRPVGMTGSGEPRGPIDVPSPEVPVRGHMRTRLLLGLTFAAGLVDAVSYLGLGKIFTANMTGNIVFLALAVGQGNLATALHSAGALICFAIGALFAGQILGPTRPGVAWPPEVTWLLFGELGCMAAFAAVWAVLGGEPGGPVLYLLIGLSSFGMGLQNAAARHLAVPGLTTTVVTMSLTGFMVDLPSLGVSGPRQWTAVLAILSLFAGAVIGGGLMLFVRVVPPFLTAATVL